MADSAAAYLSQPFQQARFAFRDRMLSGQLQMQPRWKQVTLAAVAGGDCIADPGSCFGTLNWAVGQIYVEHEFRPETKTKVEQLVTNLTAAFRGRLERVDWMSPDTKVEALRKLDTYTVKVGYPDHARDYSAVDIRRDDLIGDVRRAAAARLGFLRQAQRRSRGSNRVESDAANGLMLTTEPLATLLVRPRSGSRPNF